MAIGAQRPESPSGRNLASQRLFEDAFSYVSEAVVILDRDLRVAASTGYMSNLVGRPGYENEGRLAIEEIHPEDRDRAAGAIARLLEHAGDRVSVDLRVATESGHWRWFEAIGINLYDHPVIQGLLVMLRNIEARKAAEVALEHQAAHDQLTDLPNRHALLDSLVTALGELDGAACIGIGFFDLDHLKDVNDTLGHAAGDVLLREVAARFEAAVPAPDRVFRLGGDEFVLVMYDCGSVDDAAERADRVRRALTGRFMVEDMEVFIGASVGVAVSHRRSGSAVEAASALLREADTAMYDAKQRGRSRVEVFSAPMQERASRHLKLTARLERALENGELELAYQPILDLSTLRTIRAEALLRWENGSFGRRRAAEVVSLAERSGLIEPLGSWVLRNAVDQAVDWHRRFGIGVSVNVSAKQLTDDRFPVDVDAALAASGLAPGELVLEITESTMVEGDDVAHALQTLREIGVRLSIDDFGTGYSALSYLRRFPVDELKLDWSFVADLGTSRNGTSVTRAIVDLAHLLDLKVTAEGVSDERQLLVLQEMGCDSGQGYLLGRPAPAEFLTRQFEAERA